MEEDFLYNIENLDSFVTNVSNINFDKIKKIIVKTVGVEENYIRNLDYYVTVKELKIIVQEKINKKNQNNFSIVSKDIVEEICKAINERIFSNILVKLSSNGIIDCAWSEQENSFVFKPIGGVVFSVPMALRD